MAKGIHNLHITMREDVYRGVFRNQAWVQNIGGGGEMTVGGGGEGGHPPPPLPQPLSKKHFFAINPAFCPKN